MAAAAGQPHLHVQSCLIFHAADAEADPSIPLATPVPLELTKSTQSEPHGDGNAGPLSARCRRGEDDATRPFKQIWPLQVPRRWPRRPYQPFRALKPYLTTTLATVTASMVCASSLSARARRRSDTRRAPKFHLNECPGIESSRADGLEPV